MKKTFFYINMDKVAVCYWKNNAGRRYMRSKRGALEGMVRIKDTT